MSARFISNECKPGTERDLRDYHFDAGYMSTERFSGALLVSLQDNQVDVEETDGLVIRVDLDALMSRGAVVLDAERHQLQRADMTQPLVLETHEMGGEAQGALSLFVTCPEFPTHHTLAGQVRFERLTLAEDPMDTGDGERIGGTLTATLARANSKLPVGTVEAMFDFAPPRRPLTDFK